MLQQVSDFELELMKIIWENGGTALYSEITTALDKKGLSTTKNTIISLLSGWLAKDTLQQIKLEDVINILHLFLKKNTRKYRQQHLLTGYIKAMYKDLFLHLYKKN